jgi:AraC-like DNA-binding protein
MNETIINHDFFNNLNTEDVSFKMEILTRQTMRSYSSGRMYYLHFIIEGAGKFTCGAGKHIHLLYKNENWSSTDVDHSSISIHREMIFLVNKNFPHTIVPGDEEEMQVLTIGFTEETLADFPSFSSIQDTIAEKKVLTISDNWYMFSVLIEDLNSLHFRQRKNSSLASGVFQCLLFRVISEIAGCQILSTHVTYTMEILSPPCKVKIKKKINLMPPYFFGAYIIQRDDYSSDKFYFHEDYAMFLILERTGYQEYIENKKIKKVDPGGNRFFFWNGKTAHRIVNSKGSPLKLLYIHFTPDYLEEYNYSDRINDLFSGNPYVTVDCHNIHMKKIERYMRYIENESELCGPESYSFFKFLLYEIFNEIIAANNPNDQGDKTIKRVSTPPPLIISIGPREQYDVDISFIKDTDTGYGDFYTHAHYGLYLVIDGEGYHMAYENNVIIKHKARKYMFFLWDGVLPLKINDTPGNHLVQRLIRFNPEHLEAFPFFRMIRHLLKKDHVLKGFCTPFLFRKIINLMDRMRFSNATTDYRRAVLFDILELLYNYMDIDFEEDFDGKTDPRIFRVIKYVRKHCDKPINLSKLKTIACLSERRLTALFKKETGKTIMHYLKDYRLSVAKELLLINIDEKILSIALDAGFQSIQNFSNEFKKAFGVSPANFRKRFL